MMGYLVELYGGIVALQPTLDTALATVSMTTLSTITQRPIRADQYPRPYILVDYQSQWNIQYEVQDRNYTTERVPVKLELRLDGDQEDALRYYEIVRPVVHNSWTTLSAAVTSAYLTDWRAVQVRIAEDNDTRNRPGWRIDLTYVAVLGLPRS